MLLLVQADKNDDYFLPKQIDVKVARSYLLVLVARSLRRSPSLLRNRVWRLSCGPCRLHSEAHSWGGDGFACGSCVARLRAQSCEISLVFAWCRLVDVTDSHARMHEFRQCRRCGQRAIRSVDANAQRATTWCVVAFA